jgi:hypothetical protein
MKRIVRLTESDLARIVKRVINEQRDSYFIDDESIYSQPSGYGGGVGYQTVRGTDVWLNNPGRKDWPSGNTSKAKQSALKLIKALGGIDISGGGAKLAQEVANDWKGFDLLTQNEFLKQWDKLTEGKKSWSMTGGNYLSWGTPFRELEDDYETGISSQMISDSIKKVNNYCKSYVDEKNTGKKVNNVVCDLFVTNDLRAPGWS